MGRLDGKVIIVTGGAGDMGQNHASRFVEEGAKVAITDIDVENGEKIAEEIGENALFIEHDVTDEEQWKETVQQTEDHFGPIAGLVNNAAITGDIAPLDEVSEEDFKKSLSINTISTFLGMKSVLPSMRKNDTGSIVNISSQAGLVANPGIISYSASKFAVTGMTRTAAHELGPENIRVNSVHPGTVETQMVAGEDFQELLGELVDETPLGRVQTEDDITNAVLYLLSDEADSTSGAQLAVDGGYTS